MIPMYRRVIYILIAPFIIFGWALYHPKEIWVQAKKEWNIK